MKTIIIYGTGCSKCQLLTETVRSVVSESGIEAKIIKETDFAKIAGAGITGTPALEVDGRIVLSGKVPSRKELEDLLLSDEVSGSRANCTCESCACGKNSKNGNPTSFWKKFLAWVIILLALISLVRVVNRSGETGESTPETPVFQSDRGKTGRTEVVYFRFGSRCPTCVRMEKWTLEVLERDFGNEIAGEKLVYRTENASALTAEKYGLNAKSLILKSFDRDGNENWVKAEKIWELSNSEEQFKQYVSDLVHAFLMKHSER